MNKPVCYKAACQWSEDACCKCEYDMECYQHFLDYLFKYKENKEKH